jgi:hypothetical protein
MTTPGLGNTKSTATMVGLLYVQQMTDDKQSVAALASHFVPWLAQDVLQERIRRGTMAEPRLWRKTKMEAGSPLLCVPPIASMSERLPSPDPAAEPCSFLYLRPKSPLVRASALLAGSYRIEMRSESALLPPICLPRFSLEDSFVHPYFPFCPRFLCLQNCQSGR